MAIAMEPKRSTAGLTQKSRSIPQSKSETFWDPPRHIRNREPSGILAAKESSNDRFDFTSDGGVKFFLKSY